MPPSLHGAYLSLHNGGPFSSTFKRDSLHLPPKKEMTTAYVFIKGEMFWEGPEKPPIREAWLDSTLTQIMN